jgi:membrane protease YdiL (CAAX protease family)
MNESEIPPLLNEVPQSDSRPKWRWAIHVGLLASYVLGLGIAGALLRSDTHKGGGSSAMPSSVRALVSMCATELGFFAAIFAIAWIFSRARPNELFLKWRGGLRPIAWGILYSVVLRVVIAMVGLLALAPIVAAKGKGAVEELRPKTEAVVDMEALKDPVYLVFALTAVSFVMAGFREELWRAGMLAGLAGVAPTLFSTRRGQYISVAIAAVIFGLGHLPQGWGGVAITGVLGLGLGWIIVRHQSAWEAIMAHGFFDATTFAALYLVIKYFPDALKQSAIFL